jgi:nucleotide-sensitive chloride channel 1A
VGSSAFRAAYRPLIHFFSVEAIFEALSRCASLHPDPLDQEDGQHDGFADDAFVDESAFETFNGDENDELSEVGRVRSDFVNDNRYAPY